MDTVSAREVVEVAQKIRDARPHTKVMIVTEDELKETAHRTLDQTTERLAKVDEELRNNQMRLYLGCFCLYLFRHLHWTAKGIVRALNEIDEIAGTFSRDYEFVQDVEAAITEETGVRFEIG